MCVFERPSSSPSPYWYIKFTQEGVTQKPVSSKVLIRQDGKTRKQTEAEAQKIEDQMRLDMKARLAGGFTTGMTLGLACDRYYDDVLMQSEGVTAALERGIAEGKIPVVRNYLASAKRLSEAFGANTPLEEITEGRILIWRDQMRLSGKKVSAKGTVGEKSVLRQGLSTGAIDAYLSVLSTLCGKAVKVWKTLDPAKRPTIPWFNKDRTRRRNKKVNHLTDEEVTKLLAAARAYDGAAAHIERVLLFLLNTGARKTEAFSLTWKRIDLKSNGQVHVHFVDQTKNNKERFVPISDQLRAMLLHWQAEQAKAGYKGDKVFDYQHPLTGRWLKPSSLNSQLKAVCAAAGVKFNLHKARHTYATNVLQNCEGASLADVGELLGHEDSDTTKIYTAFVRRKLNHVVSYLDANWQGASPSPASD